MHILTGSFFSRQGPRKVSPGLPIVIFDTDFNTDPDDFYALQALNAYANAGFVTIGAVVTQARAAAVVNGVYNILKIFGRQSIVPIGVTSSSTYTTVGSAYTALAAIDTGGPGLSVPNAVTLIRQTLNNAQDGQCIYLSVGYRNNVVELLSSGANYLSDGINKTGIELLKQKCAYQVCMGGIYAGAGPNPEYNFGGSDAQPSVQNWPAGVPSYFVGYELGETINVSNTRPQTTSVAGGGLAWDSMATHFACLGPKRVAHWSIARGTITVTGSGNTSWSADGTGPHHVLTQVSSNATIAAVLTTWCNA